MRILVVDDEEEVRGVVARALRAEGHVVRTAADLAEAADAMAEGADLVVLDLRLPDGFGLDLCRSLRAEGHTLPILLLTASTQVAMRVQGLDAGADDFLAKPFAIAELRARVRALGRRGAFERGLIHTHADVRLDFAARRAVRAGIEVAVTAKEWAILEFLAQRNGRVVARGDLLEGVWGEEGDSAAGSMEVLIARLRRKLGAEIIRTLRGEGYALVASDGPRGRR
jgi:DNA-binding response OmpR family regulator